MTHGKVAPTLQALDRRNRRGQPIFVSQKNVKSNAPQDELGKVRVADTGGREELVSVGEEEVDTSPLLTHLNKDTVHRSEKHAILGLETVEVASTLREVVLFDTLDDRVHLAGDFGVFGLVSTKFGEVDLSLLDVSALDVEAGGLWSKHRAEEDKSSEDELNGDREAPGEGVVAVVERVVDGVGKETARISS